MTRSAKYLVERLFAEQYAALLAFFYRRARSKADAPDLAQEVYLRMLRVSDVDAIQSPQRYLFTVASNLLKENAVLDRRRGSQVDVDQASAERQLQELPTFDQDIDTAQRVARLRVVLGQLPPKCRAAVVLQYRYGLSYQEIADRLEVSPHMVKKYLARALLHCRGRMGRLA
jgi:RNA polymerase sigma-70 factor (ECF subfamily)